MKNLTVQLCLAFGLVQSTLSQTTIIIQPDPLAGKDCEVFSLSLTTNYNTDVLRGNAFTFDGTPGTQRALFEFDLSQVPSNAIISSVRLSLFAPDSPHSQYHYGMNEAYIQRITSSWTENLVTWNNQPPTTTLNQVSLPATTADYQNYENIDVTAMVKDMVADPVASHGFMLRLQQEQEYRRMTFCASDYPVPAKRPKLEIIYTTPVGLYNIGESIGLSFFPNPVSEVLRIRSSKEGGMSEYVFSLFDSLGETIKAGRLSGSDEIDLAGVAPQFLTLQISDANGKLLVCKKLIKE